MADSPRLLAFGQTSATRVSSPYSIRNTGLLAPVNGDAGGAVGVEAGPQHGPVEIGDEILTERGVGVNQPDRKAEPVGDGGEPAIVRDLIGAGEVEVGALLERGDTARMHAVTTRAGRRDDAVLHDRAHRGVANVDPALVGIVGQRRAQRRRGKPRGVVAKRLQGAGAEVAEHDAAGVVQASDHGRGCRDVDDVAPNVDGRVQRAAELDLPRAERGRARALRDRPVRRACARCPRRSRCTR